MVNWGAPGLIIVAATYTKYDTYAVNQMPASIELLRYQHYEGGIVVVEGLKDIWSYGWGYPWPCYLKDSSDIAAVLTFVKVAYEYEQ